MPSPITHVAVGYAIYRLARSRRRGVTTGVEPAWLLLAVACFVAMLPDLDVPVGLALGDLGRFHNYGTHSLIVGLGVALALAGIASLARLGRFLTWFLVVLACYELHVILDFFTVGRGVMVFWPFSSARLGSPFKLFYGVHWSDGLFTVRHIWTVLTELGLIALAVLAVTFWPRKRGSASPAENDPATGVD